MLRLASIPLGLLLAACSPPVLFAVDVDEPIEGGTLTLNGHSARLASNVDGAYWATWDGSDADGQIEVRFADGSTTHCPVGYVTNGMTEVQRYRVKARKCRQELR